MTSPTPIAAGLSRISTRMINPIDATDTKKTVTNCQRLRDRAVRLIDLDATRGATSSIPY